MSHSPGPSESVPRPRALRSTLHVLAAGPRGPRAAAPGASACEFCVLFVASAGQGFYCILLRVHQVKWAVISTTTGTQALRQGSVCVERETQAAKTAGDGIQRKGKARGPHFPGSGAAGVVGAMQSGFPSHFTRSAFGEAKAEGDGEAAVVATLLPRLSARM